MKGWPWPDPTARRRTRCAPASLGSGPGKGDAGDHTERAAVPANPGDRRGRRRGRLRTSPNCTGTEHAPLSLRCRVLRGSLRPAPPIMRIIGVGLPVMPPAKKACRRPARPASRPSLNIMFPLCSPPRSLCAPPPRSRGRPRCSALHPATVRLRASPPSPPRWGGGSPREGPRLQSQRRDRLRRASDAGRPPLPARAARGAPLLSPPAPRWGVRNFSSSKILPMTRGAGKVGLEREQGQILPFLFSLSRVKSGP